MLILVATAYGWNWGGRTVSGNSVSWRLCANDFTAAGAVEVEKGFRAWNAGAGTENRGADWTFNQNGDRNSCALNNFYNEVFKKSGSWFDSRGEDPLTTLGKTFDDIQDRDIVLNSDFTFSTAVPSDNLVTGNPSLGQLAMHEAGHMIGFQHEDDVLAVMNSLYPNGGDISKTKYRINEDDYAGLATKKPDGSTGKNLMLTSYRVFPQDPGLADDQWARVGPRWDVCNDRTYGGVAGPPQINALLVGTSTQSP